ncbi:hypothetical protein Hanom_Chr17g01559581 [Helianthus anomalus]
MLTYAYTKPSNCYFLSFLLPRLLSPYIYTFVIIIIIIIVVVIYPIKIKKPCPILSILTSDHRYPFRLI